MHSSSVVTMVRKALQLRVMWSVVPPRHEFTVSTLHVVPILGAL